MSSQSYVSFVLRRTWEVDGLMLKYNGLKTNNIMTHCYLHLLIINREVPMWSWQEKLPNLKRSAHHCDPTYTVIRWTRCSRNERLLEDWNHLFIFKLVVMASRVVSWETLIQHHSFGDVSMVGWVPLWRSFLSRYAVVKKVSPEENRGRVVEYSPSTGLSVPAYGKLRIGNWRAASSKKVKAVNQQLLPPLNRIRWTRSW